MAGRALAAGARARPALALLRAARGLGQWSVGVAEGRTVACGGRCPPASSPSCLLGSTTVGSTSVVPPAVPARHGGGGTTGCAYTPVLAVVPVVLAPAPARGNHTHCSSCTKQMMD